MWRLESKKVLVTGGTKGIGKACVEQFLELGAEVLFTARTSSEVDDLEYELKDQGYQVKGLVADASKLSDSQSVLKWISENWRRLDVLVNNAGINIRKKAHEYSEDEYKRVLDINLVAPFTLSRLLFPLLKISDGSTIINVASSAALQDVGTGTPYAMSKAGLLQQTRSLAVEWASEGIRVNAVSPWFTKTPLTEGYLHNDEKMKSIISRTPLKRVAEAKEIASIVAFLAMPASSFVTGQNIVADGGMSINAL
ncbi:SDR family oxidoreductase [Christiangramia sp. OXR-203]|jgi:Tropinone reductase 1|uniref:SDR family oxidoreductase n=1 Tax=Christiangramia sp. OXR-203 TaxID=3100176 RepID=UPI002AC9A1A4|nr:SDR family oxidoreductase [Christiangramia sp. OXR-203]WPY99239.1 SDR family oxidoreductase [Christiangramia sp. OXR-203]